MIGRATLTIGLALTAGTGFAQQSLFDGDWATGDPAQCEVQADATNMAWRIQDGTIWGVESLCRMTNPVGVRDMNAMLYDLECTGEGQVWGGRALLMIDADGQLVFIRDGFASILPRCTGYASSTQQPQPTKRH